jgi:hypothetical protein
MKLVELDLGPSKVKPQPLGYAVWPDKHEVPFYSGAQAKTLLKRTRSVETFVRYDPTTVVEINGSDVRWGLPDIEPPYYLVGCPVGEVIQQLIQYLRAKGLTFETHQQGNVIEFVRNDRKVQKGHHPPFLRWTSKARRVVADVLNEGGPDLVWGKQCR